MRRSVRLNQVKRRKFREDDEIRDDLEELELLVNREVRNHSPDKTGEYTSEEELAHKGLIMLFSLTNQNEDGKKLEELHTQFSYIFRFFPYYFSYPSYRSVK